MLVAIHITKARTAGKFATTCNQTCTGNSTSASDRTTWKNCHPPIETCNNNRELIRSTFPHIIWITISFHIVLYWFMFIVAFRTSKSSAKNGFYIVRNHTEGHTFVPALRRTSHETLGVALLLHAWSPRQACVHVMKKQHAGVTAQVTCGHTPRHGSMFECTGVCQAKSIFEWNHFKKFTRR